MKKKIVLKFCDEKNIAMNKFIVKKIKYSKCEKKKKVTKLGYLPIMPINDRDKAKMGGTS